MIYTKPYCQSSTISSDSVLVNLTITGLDNKSLETEIFFENLSSHKTKIYKSNKEGKAKCVLYTGENYQIKIPNSDDNYEYNIPEFTISPLNLTFKFSKKENVFSSIGIRFFNNNSNQKDFILKSKTADIPYKVINDTVHIELNSAEEYSIFIKDVTIKNNSITTSGNRPINYILSFIDEKHAELITMQSDEAAINIIYSNLSGLPQKDEPVIIKGSKLEYKFKTLSNGSALAIVPAVDEYKISLRYFPDVFKLNMKKELNVIYTNTVRLEYPSSKEFENQRKEEASRISKRDSLYIKYEKRLEVRLGSIEDQLQSQGTTAINELLKVF